MEQIIKTISTLLDLLYFEVVGPAFLLFARGLDMLLIQPLQFLHVPPFLQVMVIALTTVLVSISLRRLLKVDEKDAAFKAVFTARKAGQDDLCLISDWKSRETFAKAIDDEIDKDFNVYLAERFARHGMVYLLPIFLSLFWLEQVMENNLLWPLPANSYNIPGISIQLVFLLTYCFVLLIYFRITRKRRLSKA